MAKACEELVEIHRLRDIAAKKAAEEAKTNKTGNKNAKVYVNSAKRGTAIGKEDAKKKGVAEDSDDSDADEDDFLNDPELERIRLARIAKLKKLQVVTSSVCIYFSSRSPFELFPHHRTKHVHTCNTGAEKDGIRRIS